MRIRHLLVLVAVSLLVAFGPPERTTPAKWALVVGVSDYTHFGDEIGGDLPGAANDARSVANVLVNRYGFDPDNVKLVLDQDATRARLETELSEWLPSVARPGDMVWFYFAGHGSQAWDMDGDEDDGLDETVCPADVMRGNTEMDILDDEIDGWLAQLPTDNVVVVWDKCHARSSTRAVTPFARPRSLDRNVEQDVARPRGATGTRAAARAGETHSEETDGDALPSGVLEIAAAQADEVAIDAAFPSKQGDGLTYGGAFTTAFVENLWNASDDATYSQIFEKTRRDMRRNRFEQQPHLAEMELTNRPLFWLAGTESAAGSDMASASAGGTARVVGAGSEGEVVLSGGSSANITVGSIYTDGNVLLEVAEVEPDRAVARVAGTQRSSQNPSAQTAEAGSSARLLAYRYPEPRLRVSITDLPGRMQQALRTQLSAVPALALIDDDASFAHLLVRPRNQHFVVMNLDGFSRDSVAAGTDAADRLAELLRREYGQYQLAELENPARPFEMTFAFGDGRNDFLLGESISFRVTAERGGYLTIVDLAPDGTVSVIFPNEYVADDRVYAGRTMQFPAAGSDLQFAAVEPAGRGIVRAFVTERPLEMPFAQGADATEADLLWNALRDAAGSPPVPGSDAIPVQSWATSAIVYEIRRP